MQKLIFILFISWSGALFSQTILNASLVTPEVKVAYRGFDNYLKIEGMEVDSNTMIISPRDTLYRLDNNYFIYKAYTSANYDTLKIYHKGKYIKSVVFKAEPLQKLKIMFGAVRDTLVTKQELLANPGLICSYEPKLARAEETVRDFEASIIRKNGKEIPLYKKSHLDTERWSEKRSEKYYAKQYPEGVHGNQFSRKQLKQIKRMKVGDVIWFKDAKYGCRTITYPDLKLRVVK